MAFVSVSACANGIVTGALVGDAAQAHRKAGLQCANCHLDGLNKLAPDSACLTCHGSYSSVASATAGIKPNPHASHMGNIRCTICHASHKPSQVYCNQCHTFESLKFHQKGR